jgi:hypothetical protein
VPTLEVWKESKESKHIVLIKQTECWRNIIGNFPSDDISTLSSSQGNQWYTSLRRAAHHLQSITANLQRIRNNEFSNAKNHLIRIGKYSPIARITNPQRRSGPVAGSFFPTKPGEPIRRAFNDNERKEASTLAHSM